MLAKDLLADHSWIQAERDAFEAKQTPERRESLLFQTGMDCGVPKLHLYLKSRIGQPSEPGLKWPEGTCGSVQLDFLPGKQMVAARRPYQQAFFRYWSGRWGSNPRPSAWEECWSTRGPSIAKALGSNTSVRLR